jgi:hypothetical protein
MRKERKILCIKIIDREAFLVPNTLGRIIAFPMLKKLIEYLGVFCNFLLTFFF